MSCSLQLLQAHKVKILATFWNNSPLSVVVRGQKLDHRFCCWFILSVEKYRNCQPLASGNSDKAVDPLLNLDSKSLFSLLLLENFLCYIFFTFCHILFPGNSPDFKAGVTALANILKIQRHDDYLVMLKVEWREGSFPIWVKFWNDLSLIYLKFLPFFVCVVFPFSGHSHSDPGAIVSRGDHQSQPEQGGKWWP